MVPLLSSYLSESAMQPQHTSPLGETLQRALQTSPYTKAIPYSVLAPALLHATASDSSNPQPCGFRIPKIGSYLKASCLLSLYSTSKKTALDIFHTVATIHHTL